MSGAMIDLRVGVRVGVERLQALVHDLAAQGVVHAGGRTFSGVLFHFLDGPGDEFLALGRLHLVEDLHHLL